MRKRDSIAFTVALLAIFVGSFSLVLGVFTGNFAWAGLVGVIGGALLCFWSLRSDARNSQGPQILDSSS